MLREALSETISSLPEQFQADRTELLGMLRQSAILYRSPTQPILSRDGTSARWMLNSLAVTLTPRGAELAGRCLLELLKRFDGRQIATYGVTAIPILQSCILQSGGRYRGLLVRKERKKHGSLKLIEGPIDKSEPVIIVDDSVSSGTSMLEGRERLEDEGLRVEGGVCMVRFGWYGGYALMQESGYHMEALYDIWDDFIYHMEDEQKPLLNPSKWFPKFEWSERRAPEGLHPATLARLVISEYLTSGELLRAPGRLDADYDSSGGAWVSVRSRKNIHLRHARDGFWHFPGESSAGAAEDVVMASLRTATGMPKGLEGLEALEGSGLAVTFFPALERCSVGELDNDRYGIVVRSLERPSRMGGALPRMPGISNEWEQFQHARRKNGQLVSFEPYEILRHEVVKAVEPETTWQPTGVPAAKETAWHEDKNICGRIAARARDLVLSRLFKRDETTDALPADLVGSSSLDSIYITIYINGRLRGCMGSVVRELDADVRRLAQTALSDERFAAENVAADSSGVAVSVSLLYNPLEMGAVTPEEIVRPVRHGQQALMVYRGQQVGLLLPFVASMYNYDRVELARAVVEKAGLTEPPYYWCRFDCVTWLADARGEWRFVGGFPLDEDRTAPLEELVARYASLHARYLVKHQRADGRPYLHYHPFQNRLYEGIDPARMAHGAWVLGRAQRILGGDEIGAAADKGLGYLSERIVEGEDGCWLESETGISTVAEVSFLLLALCNLPDEDARRAVAAGLASTLWASVDATHGHIRTHRPPAESPDAFQDYFPGQVLLALAHACEQGLSDIDEDRLYRSFRFYRHRYRHKRHFGQVSWLMQAFAAWWRVTRDGVFAEFVFEIGEWLLGYQQEKTGAFINDHQPDTPGYTTALYLEGVGAAMNLAASLGDEARRRKYLDSYERGLRFLDRLIIQPRDAAVLPNPELSFGGLRQGLHYSEIRIDFVQHSLSAILEFHSSTARAPHAARHADIPKRELQIGV
jgi:orotate phosphoribosyltransferase/AMMECR1 domain-containing protein